MKITKKAEDTVFRGWDFYKSELELILNGLRLEGSEKSLELWHYIREEMTKAHREPKESFYEF